MDGYDNKSDIWSVGCVVLELLCGGPPYFDMDPMAACFNIVQDPHPPLSSSLDEGTKVFFFFFCFVFVLFFVSFLKNVFWR